jgi:hypothetical protein
MRAVFFFSIFLVNDSVAVWGLPGIYIYCSVTLKKKIVFQCLVRIGNPRLLELGNLVIVRLKN